LVLRLMPEVLGAAFRTPRLLPKRMGALSHDLIEPFFGFRQHPMRISERGQLAATVGMYPRFQSVELFVRHQLGVGGGLQRFLFERLFLVRRGIGLYGKRMKKLDALPLNVD
jgi:hypothetical protein